MSAHLLIPTAEAAFIAGLTDRQMNRVVDEHLVPDTLFEQQGKNRRFTRLCAAFARFYFDTEDVLIATARRKVLEELTHRVERLQRKDDVFALHALPEGMSWKVARNAVEIDMAPYIADARVRARDVDQAEALVVVDPDILGGEPVFAGTRVPIEIVLASQVAGVDIKRLQASYPFLTQAHLQAAQVYQEVHPRRGRPRRLEDATPGLTRRITRMVRSARA